MIFGMTQQKRQSYFREQTVGADARADAGCP
jgi:hypothetical protein